MLGPLGFSILLSRLRYAVWIVIIIMTVIIIIITVVVVDFSKVIINYGMMLGF